MNKIALTDKMMAQTCQHLGPKTQSTLASWLLGMTFDSSLHSIRLHSAGLALHIRFGEIVRP